MFSSRGKWRRACFTKDMILLITPSANGEKWVKSLHAATSQEVRWAHTLQEASTCLREQTYSAAVIDQFLLETEPEESDQMTEHLGTAFPSTSTLPYQHGALAAGSSSGAPATQAQEATARRSIAEQMHSEMRETLTAMMLSCELALSVPDVPSLATEKIQVIDNLARELRLRLEVN